MSEHSTADNDHALATNLGSPKKRMRTESYLAEDLERPIAFPPDEIASLARGVTYNFINNAFVMSKSRTWARIHDPVTQTVISRVPDSAPEDTKAAVLAANSVQPKWAATSLSQRRSKMLSFLTLLKQNSSRIRHCLCVEVGKTLTDADAEFERAVDAIETACSITNEMGGFHHSNSSTVVHTIHEPLGITLSVTPFNFPLMIPLWSIPLSILAGNAVVLKPSEQAPSVVHILAECFLRAGFPAGVFNVVHGGANVVNQLLSEPSIRAVNFVGSDIAGELVYEHAKATRKRIQAECGGKNHGVVLEDANKMKTLYAIAGSAFGAAGQRCMALSVVVFVGETKHWVADLVQLARSLVIGSGLDPRTEIGPVISSASKKRIEGIITKAEVDGAEIVLDGRRPEVPDFPHGNFIGPTILTNVNPTMSCYKKEVFGPVLCCLTVDTLEEAINIINQNKYGNGCTLFTQNPATSQIFQHAVNVGQIGINVPVLLPGGPVLRTPNKESFLGDMNVQGRSLWQFYTMTKTITSLWS